MAAGNQDSTAVRRLVSSCRSLVYYSNSCYTRLVFQCNDILDVAIII